MVMLKTANELKKMKIAGEISAGALKIAKDTIRVGVSTAYIDQQVHGYILERGAKPSFLGYGGFPGSICISINDEVIHGIPGDRKIADGDIVSIDVGATVDGFHGDNAATFAVGEVSGENLKLIEVTRECLFRAIAVAKKGNRIGDIGHAVQSYAEENGFSVVREFIGHGVGKKLHEDPEVPNFGVSGHGVRLLPGMTLAIEPMINAGQKEIHILKNGWTVVTEDGSNSAHFEMSVAITDNEPVILTEWREVL